MLKIRLLINQFAFILAAIGVSLVISSCGSDQGDDAVEASYEGVGLVKNITETRTFVNVDHEAIPGFMDAMVMFFPVVDSTVLENVAVDDSIKFVVDVAGIKYAISSIEVIE